MSARLTEPVALLLTDCRPCPLFSVTTTPALLFYLGGTPLTIRRTDWADDTKFTGSIGREKLAEMLTSARSAENDGARTLYVDF